MRLDHQVLALFADAQFSVLGADMACEDAFVHRGEGVVDVAMLLRHVAACAWRRAGNNAWCDVADAADV